MYPVITRFYVRDEFETSLLLYWHCIHVCFEFTSNTNFSLFIIFCNNVVPGLCFDVFQDLFLFCIQIVHTTKKKDEIFLAAEKFFRPTTRSVSTVHKQELHIQILSYNIFLSNHVCNEAWLYLFLSIIILGTLCRIERISK